MSLVYSQYTTKELSEARYNISTVKFDDKILFVGGDRGDNTVDYLNLSNLEITSEDYSSDGMTGAQILSNDRYAFFFDLFGVNTGLREYFIFDNENLEWIEGKYELIRDADDGYIIGNEVYLFDDNDLDSLYVFNIETKEWRSESSPFPHRDFKVIQDEEFIYCIGGKVGNTKVNNIEILNLSTMTWESSSLVTARRSPSALFYKDKILIHGGFGDRSREVEIFDRLQKTSEVINIGVMSDLAFMITSKDKLVIAGDDIADAIIVDLITNEVESYQLENTISLKHISGGVIGDKIILGGGSTGFENLYEYNLTQNTWQNITLNEGRQKVSMINTDQYLFVAGGQTENGETNELLIFEVQLEDNDNDGFDVSVDCDDDNPNVNPGSMEIPYNDLDDDCNPNTFDDDIDQDGFLLVDDCDDNNPDINPSAVEIPNNGIDEDCDGMDLLSSVHNFFNSTINIYPNPANDIINISVRGNLNYKSLILTMEGKIIHVAKNQSKLEIDNIPFGTYILKIQDLDSGQEMIEKIIIENL